MHIEHKDNGSQGAFYLEQNGKVIGQLDYIWGAPNVMVINHTEVDPAYENHGLGKDLVDASVEYARDNNKKIVPLCPFAKDLMESSRSYSDVLEEPL